MNKSGNLLVPISGYYKEDIYLVTGVYEELQKLFICTLTLVSETHLPKTPQVPTLLNNFHQGIIITTINHSIVHFNQNAEKMIPKHFLQFGVSIAGLLSNYIFGKNEYQLLQEQLNTIGYYKSEFVIGHKTISLKCFWIESERRYVYMFEESKASLDLQQQRGHNYFSEIGKMTSTIVHEMQNLMTSI